MEKIEKVRMSVTIVQPNGASISYVDTRAFLSKYHALGEVANFCEPRFAIRK
jgi:hypothetical protein